MAYVIETGLSDATFLIDDAGVDRSEEKNLRRYLLEKIKIFRFFKRLCPAAYIPTMGTAIESSRSTRFFYAIFKK